MLEAILMRLMRRFPGLAGARRQAAAARVLDLLQPAPMPDAQVRRAADIVALDAARALQLVEPGREQGRRIRIEGEELLHQQVGHELQAPGIVGGGPEEDEQKPRIARDARHAGKAGKVGWMVR